MAHSDALGVTSRDQCTLSVLRELEEAWRPQAPALEAADMREASVALRLSTLRTKALDGRAAASVAASGFGGLSIGGFGVAAQDVDGAKVRAMGVPAQYEAQRRAELSSLRFVSVWSPSLRQCYTPKKDTKLYEYCSQTVWVPHLVFQTVL